MDVRLESCKDEPVWFVQRPGTRRGDRLLMYMIFAALMISTGPLFSLASIQRPVGKQPPNRRGVLEFLKAVSATFCSRH
jgi:hypothetical protein